MMTMLLGGTAFGFGIREVEWGDLSQVLGSQVSMVQTHVERTSFVICFGSLLTKRKDIQNYVSVLKKSYAYAEPAGPNDEGSGRLPMGICVGKVRKCSSELDKAELTGCGITLDATMR